MFEEFAPNFKFRNMSKNTKKALKLYKDRQNIEELIESLDTGKGLVLFGAGGIGNYAYAVLYKKNIVPDYFIDNDPAKWGKRLNGIPIISVSDYKTIRKKMNLVITMPAYFPAVEQLDEMGLLDTFKGFLITIDPEKDEVNCLNGAHGLSLLSNIEKSITDHALNIEKVFSMLEDEKSRNTLYAIINYHLTKNLNYLYTIAEYNQRIYFDNEIVKLADEECFVDAGAYDGADSKKFINITNNKFRKILLFEPQKNCRQIIENNLPLGKDPRVCIYELGLYDSETELCFSANDGMAAAINDTGSETIRTTILDKYLDDMPTYIKMDIEGAELAALRGGGQSYGINQNLPSAYIITPLTYGKYLYISKK